MSHKQTYFGNGGVFTQVSGVIMASVHEGFGVTHENTDSMKGYT